LIGRQVSDGLVNPQGQPRPGALDRCARVDLCIQQAGTESDAAVSAD
jgi:hypothetical protein